MVLALYILSDDHLSMYQALFNPLQYFQRYAMNELNAAKIRKVSNFVNTGDRVIVFAFCNFTHSPLSVYQVSFNYLQYFSDMLQTSLLFKKIEKNNSVITCDRVTVLAFYSFSDSLLSMYHVSFNSLLHFRNMLRTSFYCKT